MLLCQRQFHQSSTDVEEGMHMSFRREGQFVIALGICSEGEHAGKTQLTILSQSCTTITNLDPHTAEFNPARVSAVMSQLAGAVGGEERDAVTALLTSEAQDSLPLPRLPFGSVSVGEWVEFPNLAKAMKYWDLVDAEVRDNGGLCDEEPQEERSEDTKRALTLLKASQEQAARAKAEDRAEQDRFEEEAFQDCEEELEGVEEETASQLQSAASTLDHAKGEAVGTEAIVLKDDVTEADTYVPAYRGDWLAEARR